MDIKKKIYHHKNKLPLNQFHQLKRSKATQQDVNSCKVIKKKIRDLERQIENGKLNEEALQIKSKQLEEQKQQLQEKQKEYKVQQKKIDYFARKYKKIKQVDLKKLKRQLIKLQKELDETDDREPLLKQEAQIQEKINYVKQYPKDQKYISLFGKNTQEHASQQQQQLIESSKKRFKQKELRKYRMIEEIQKEVNDDFLCDEELEINKKQLVGKQGKIINF